MDDCDWLLSVEKACDWLRIEPGVTRKFFLGHPVISAELQVYEMWAAGYSFFLLNNVFTSHWGFQKSSARPSWRWRESGVNSRKFDKFRKEVSTVLSTWDYFVFNFDIDISPL